MKVLKRVGAALAACVLAVSSPVAHAGSYPNSASGSASNSASGSGLGSGPDIGPNKAMNTDNGAPLGGHGPIQYSFLHASLAAQKTPNMAPSGTNDWSCVPKTGDEPVILIPGTGEGAYATWSYYGPKLKAAGKCVYTFEYNPVTVHGDNKEKLQWLQFAGDIRQSAAALKAFTQRVLTATGSSKVDLVGHSQGGGPLPIYYLNKLGGAAYVDQLIGLVPSHRGTQPLAIDKIADVLQLRYPLEVVSGFFNADAWMQQLAGSELMKELYGNGPITRPGVKYTVLSTKYDDVVMPNTNSFIHEPGVKNIEMQDICSKDYTDHFGFAYDPIAYQLAENELTGKNKTPKCVFVRPFHQ